MYNNFVNSQIEPGELLETALLYASAGIPIFPCKPNKAPATASGFRDATTDPDQIKKWFSSGDRLIGIPTGTISAIDVEDAATAEAFEAELFKAAIPALVRQRTPSGGAHFLFKSEGEPIKNMKLARAKEGGKDGLLIETRGQGGYICTGGGYQWQRGDLTQLTTLTSEQTEDVISIARSFDRLPKEKKPSLKKHDDTTPGDDFNRRGDWRSLLMSHGWTQAGGTRWRRPGKASGVSADWIPEANFFHVFSSNAEPLEGGASYNPFALLAILEYNSNFSEAAKALAKQGFGSRIERDPTVDIDKKLEPTTGPAKHTPEAIFQQFRERIFDVANEPPELEPVLTLNGIPAATVGNLVFVGGQAGTAKSQWTAAAIASSFANAGADCLGWELSNPEGLGIAYIELEQSVQDFHRLLKTACKRAGVETPPEWVQAYNLTGITPLEANYFLRGWLAQAKARFGGVRCVFLDGIADLINSPNDEAESFAVIRELHALAIEYNCVIYSVLHQNAGAESVKMRGHIGSQAERKAETVLTLKRQADGAIVAFSTKARHRPIFEKEGPRFDWNDEQAMFCSIESVANIRSDAKAEQRKELARAIFAGQRDHLSHAEAVSRIMELEGIKQDAAKKRLAVLRNERFVRLGSMSGNYSLEGALTHD